MRAELLSHANNNGDTENLTRLVNKHVVKDDAIETSEYVHSVVMDDC